jgi:hypothetical protein
MNTLNDTFIKTQGLNPRRIRLHQRRILQALNHEINTDIQILEACTLHNNMIIPWNHVQSNIKPNMHHESQNWHKNHTLNCIPAAGAASRFFLELQYFVKVLGDAFEFGLQLKPSEIIQQFPFTEKLIRQVTQISEVTEESLLLAYKYVQKLLQTYSHEPKLNTPATNEGDSFLKLKIEEQMRLLNGLGSTIVVPAKMKKKVENLLYQLKPKEYEKWLVLEQDLKLSTIRFHRDGKPYLDENGKYSIVSAGHGELLNLFDKIAQHFPQSHCLHIRNIDNIIGTTEEKKQEFNIFSSVFYYLRNILELIRKKIPQINFNHSSEIEDQEISEKIKIIYKLLNTPHSEYLSNHINQTYKLNCLELYNLFCKIFHWPKVTNLTTSQIWLQMLENSEKPLSVFAVVSKKPNDVGGGPVFAKISDGSQVKLCIEMPHASAEDSKKFFSEKGTVTHFNPAIVFFETRTHTFDKDSLGKKVNFVQLFDERFWLLSKREYKGVPVCYHETVLYELLGNSATTNLVFVEVPRSLFNPHKSYLDCLGQSRESYGFDKNFDAE